MFGVSGLLPTGQRRADVLKAEADGSLVHLRGSGGAAVADDALMVVGVDGGLAERTDALVYRAGGVDVPVGGGALMTGRGEALGGYPLGLPGQDGQLLLPRVRALVQLSLVAERLADRAAQGVEPVSLGASRPGRARR